MDISLEDLSIKTVSDSYSWDQGNPNSSIVVNCSSDGNNHYIGYAPYVNTLIKSTIKNQNAFAIAFDRTANFGDYYNSESNVQTTTTSGSHIFCHNYIMPGDYTLIVSQTQYITLNNYQRFDCLQRYCMDWKWRSRTYVDGAQYNTTWSNTISSGIFEKKWRYEKCDDDTLGTYGLYIERGFDTEKRLPFSWQWYNFFKNDYDRRTEFYASFEPRQEELTWDDCVFQGSKQVTWDQAIGPCVETRPKDVSWWWKNVRLNSTDVLNQKVTWFDSRKEEMLPRTWRQVRGAGCLEEVPLLSSQTITTTRQMFVSVLEIPPTAYLSVTPLSSNQKISPYTVVLSPRNIRCGSFPIEKLIWDLGDGSPIIEQSRWSLNAGKPFVYSDAFSYDFDDPRNFDLVHTYNRTSSSGNCFYPSITAISSSTGTFDCAATVVGPIEFENSTSAKFHLLQNYLTENGSAYVGEINNDVIFLNKPK